MRKGLSFKFNEVYFRAIQLKEQYTTVLYNCCIVSQLHLSFLCVSEKERLVSAVPQ